MRLIYLGSPYFHKRNSVMHKRVSLTAHCLAFFRRTAENVVLYSPIVQWSRVAFENELPHDFGSWAQQDFFMIRKSSALWVLAIDGWQESFGLSQEIEYANDIGHEILYIIPEGIGLDGGPNYVLTTDKPI